MKSPESVGDMPLRSIPDGYLHHPAATLQPTPEAGPRLRTENLHVFYFDILASIPEKIVRQAEANPTAQTCQLAENYN